MYLKVLLIRIAVLFSCGGAQKWTNTITNTEVRKKDWKIFPSQNRSTYSDYKPAATSVVQAASLYSAMRIPSRISETSSQNVIQRQPFNGTCRPLVQCSPFFEEVIQSNSFCDIDSNLLGASCRSPSNHTGDDDIKDLLTEEAPPAAAPAPLNLDSLEAELVEVIAAQALQNQNMIELELQNSGSVVNNRDTPEFQHFQFLRTRPEANNIAQVALQREFQTKALQERVEAETTNSINGNSSSIAPFLSYPMKMCSIPPSPRCSLIDYFYRRYDGSCNNFKNPTWGQTFTAFERMAPPIYSDGISAPRKAVSGKELPSPRIISLEVVKDINKPNHKFTLSVMQWGQFIDHDITHTPIFSISDKEGLQCCKKERESDLDPLEATAKLHPECLPIRIPRNDPFYSKFRRSCMNFVRSLPAPDLNCQTGPRNQMNQLSHFMDGSQIYGSSKDVSNKLREFQSGRLRQENDTFLPSDPEQEFQLIAGDFRVNEQPLLSILHTIWVRQHNRIAGEISAMNPSWDDELIFQESRRIVVAQIQHIVYNEWLPLILGTRTAEKFWLLPQHTGFIDSYNEFVNPSILNEFSTAAYRFGHTLVQGHIRMFDMNHKNVEAIELENYFNQPRILSQRDRFDQLLRGLVKQPIQSFDNYMADDLTNKLFKTSVVPYGLDLASLNIQRGRDHGIGSYNNLRTICGLASFSSFNQLNDVMKPKTVLALERVYKDVRDIDAFIGGISEEPVEGGILGPTFSCIVAQQFARLKFGDRFFYENGGRVYSFSNAQLDLIRQTSWARIICENSKTIKTIQPLAFRLPDEHNQKTSCDSNTIPKWNLSSWYH